MSVLQVENLQVSFTYMKKRVVNEKITKKDKRSKKKDKGCKIGDKGTRKVRTEEGILSSRMGHDVHVCRLFGLSVDITLSSRCCRSQHYLVHHMCLLKQLWLLRSVTGVSSNATVL